MSHRLFFIAFLLLTLCPVGVQGSDIISEASVEEALQALDVAIVHRKDYINRKRAHIEALKRSLASTRSPLGRMSRCQDIAGAYRAFDNDSSLAYLRRGRAIALKHGNDSMAMSLRLHELAQLALSGFTAPVAAAFDAITIDSLPGPELQALYFESKRRFYSFVAMVKAEGSAERAMNERLALEAQDSLLTRMSADDPNYPQQLAENLLAHGDVQRARAYALEQMRTIPVNDPRHAHLAYTMAMICEARQETTQARYYLARSALADVQSATLEVSSLQALGRRMYDARDLDRAMRYLTLAVECANESRAEMRVIQSGGELATIEAATRSQSQRSHNRVLLFFWIMVSAVVVLAVALLLLHRNMKRISRLKDNLEEANHTRELYISRFLELCSIYMDKLNQLGNLVNRKIQSGNVEELQKLLRSGKFIEEQSGEFYNVFDAAFLHLYPDFTAKVNALFAPDKQLETPADGLLNPDLRILAMMRMGISDSRRIAELLNFSVNTIYAYRNRLKNRAINRDTFETDLMAIR